MTLQSRYESLCSRYQLLLKEVQSDYPLDQLITENASSVFQSLNSIRAALSSISDTEDWRHVELTPHPMSYTEVIAGREDNTVPHATVRAWRRQPTKARYANIPFNARKEIFDCFFRADVHGVLENDNMVLLSRGTPEPIFFAPPNIVKAGLQMASAQNWFGYSDSLGHIDTRNALAALERQRRHTTTINADNCAVILGGTLGMHAVLTMIAKEDPRRKCVILLPNYAPVVDDVSSMFDILPIALNTDFTVDMQAMEQALHNPDTSTCIISWPHNPASFDKAEEQLRKIMDICAARSIYCIVDEISFSPYELRDSDLQNPYFISINSYSKTYNIPGLKLGHLMASKAFIDRFYRHASTTYGSPLSYLYLCLTLLATAETNNRASQMISLYPDTINAACSDPALLQRDFDLWVEIQRLVRDTQVAITRHMLKTFEFKKGSYFGINDASPNFVLRCSLNISSYQMMLNTVHDTNVSVFPVDCFVPPEGWPCDIRITYSVPPHLLVTALARVCRVVKNWEEMGNNNIIPVTSSG